MEGDVMQAMSLANEMDPMMLDRDRCGDSVLGFHDKNKPPDDRGRP